MIMQFVRIFAGALGTLLLVATLALAVEKRMTGKVMFLDEETSQVMLRSQEGKRMALNISRGLMSTVEVGDQVEVVSDNHIVKSIKRLQPTANN